MEGEPDYAMLLRSAVVEVVKAEGAGQEPLAERVKGRLLGVTIIGEQRFGFICICLP